MNRAKIFIGRLLLKFVPLQVFPALNRLVYNFMGHKLASNVVIYSSVEVLGLIKVDIGENTFIGHRSLFMGGDSRVVIGRNCDISSNVSIICGSHLLGTSSRRAGKGISRDIIIGEGVWIGFGSIILGGVVIGDGAVIAAGSLVNKSVPSNTIYGGIPARELRRMVVS
jgi:maltose O-acetyltransferase